MDAPAVIAFPRAVAPPTHIGSSVAPAPATPTDDHLVAAEPPFDDEPRGAADRAILEIDAAIALVRAGAARRVRVTGLPLADDVAGIGLARAVEAGVRFALERLEPAGAATVTVGPLE